MNESKDFKKTSFQNNSLQQIKIEKKNKKKRKNNYFFQKKLTTGNPMVKVKTIFHTRFAVDAIYIEQTKWMKPNCHEKK